MDVRVGTIKKAEHQRINALKLWCWKRLSRTLWTERRSNQSLLREINSEYSLERLMLEAKAPILWPPDAKSCFIGKDLDAGKDWGQEKGAAEDKMVGWHHRLNEHESLDLNLLEKTQGDCEGQGSLACCSYGTWVGHWKTITIEYSMLYLYYLSFLLKS